MNSAASVQPVFRATPVVDFQAFVSAEKPEIPASYELRQVGGVWLASDRRLPVVSLLDSGGRRFGLLVGFVYSEFEDRFLREAEVAFPVSIEEIGDVERLIMPRLAGLFILLTCEWLPLRIYMDPGGSFPMVYSGVEKRAASSPALLLDESAYEARFRVDLHDALIGQEGAGGWISGTLTAHQDVLRVLPNHYLDLATWTAHRFWPKPGDFDEWRPFEATVEKAAESLRRFSNAACDTFQVAATMTAGFDSRLLLASCREVTERCEFFTIRAPDAELDIEVSKGIAERLGLSHRVLPLRQAEPGQVAIWDRTVGDCMVEAPRRTHPTLRELVGREAMFTGMYGEVGRCRLYRQDYLRINDAKIDARFVIDRLTLPPHPELIENVAIWLRSLEGQPNSVILDLAFHELKFGNWAMGQRPFTNSIKLNFVPFAQRAVMDAFLGVSPAQKGTEDLFWALIKRLWPELAEVPINKYGDARDYMTLWKKVSNPHRVRRFLRDRLAKKARRVELIQPD